jgi:hypothetical protein
MSTEQRIYQGNLVQRLVQIVEQLQTRSRFMLQDSEGNTFGVSCEMSQHEADDRNMGLAKVCEYRWCVVPEKKR